MMKKYVMFVKGDKILIQDAEYIEDGFYIEVYGSIITLFEIPMFGDQEQNIGQFNTIMEAILHSETLS